MVCCVEAVFVDEVCSKLVIGFWQVMALYALIRQGGPRVPLVDLSQRQFQSCEAKGYLSNEQI
jgi:hypothetical protein